MSWRSSCLQRLRRLLTNDSSGVAVVEFGATAPFLMLVFLSGMELGNYTLTKMRVSQLALQIADNGSRMGTVPAGGGSEQVSEADVDDVLTGAGLGASGLNLYTNGRVIMSSLEPEANPNTSNKYKIRWQRCRGIKNVTSQYGVQGTANMTSMGPTGRQVTASIDNGNVSGVIVVEVLYDYQPLFSASLVPHITFDEFGAMMVRADRNYTAGPNDPATGAPVGITTVSGVTASTCDRFTTT